MVHFVYYLTNLLFSDISLIYYNINLRSSLIFCPFSGDIFCSLGISLSDSDPLTELNNKSFKYVALCFITKVVTLENVKFLGEISNNLPNGLIGKNVYKTFFNASK